MTITNEQLKVIGRYYSILLQYNWNIPSEWTYLYEKHEEAYRKAMDEILTFTTRDEYLAWSADWKAQYQELSQNIRLLKNSRKLKSPTFRPDAAWQAELAGWNATVMLWIRACSKGRSKQLRDARVAAEKAKA